ncbi:tapemeasure [Mycobacterium phage Madruga]|uniref:Tapemeasure n=1 Tax=Mycobacterium phage Madruga TaxID=1675552 RepID=A0A0K1LRZ4_9CAUD|nr:tapemeasure [Mycobacterium phage Madruga]
MPNDNLGTAHGRIRITYEGKGADKANAALIKMAAQMEQMNKRLEQVQKALEESNSELDRTSREMRKAGKSSAIFSADILRTHRRIRTFRNEVGYLRDDLKSLGRFAQSTRTNFNRLGMAMRLFNRAGQFSGDQQVAIFRAMSVSMAELAARTKGTAQTIHNFTHSTLRLGNRLAGTQSAVTLLGSAYLGLRNKIFGVQQAIDKSPGWVRKMHNVTIAVGALSGAMGILGLAIRRFGLLEKLARAGVFKVLANGAHGGATAFRRFGKVTESVFGKDYFSGFVRRLLRAENSLDEFAKNADNLFHRVGVRITANAAGMRKWATESKSLVAGIALAVSSLTNLWGRLQWFFKLPKPLLAGLAIFFSRVLPSALYATGKALVSTSNFITGLWDGIKVLTKGLTVLPGILAGIVAGVTSLIPVFSGLKDAFKDVFSEDPQKAWEAYAKLPAHLRPIADAIRKFIPVWQNLQTRLQSFAFAGVEKQMESLGNTYFPILEKGALRVVGALRNAKDRVVEFMQQADTQAEISNIYGDLAQGLNQMADAIKPVLSGLKDMAAVGSEFLQTNSVWVTILSERFRDWASVNRQNGNMAAWMSQARQGAYDLGKGLIDLTKSAYRLITLFADRNSGADFLDRFADAMERLNQRIEDSAATGFLRNLREGVRELGEKRMDDLIRLWKIFRDTMEAVSPFVQQISDSFTNIFIPAADRALWIIQQFINALDATGLTRFIGWILGAAGAIRLLPKVYSTAITAAKLFGATFFILRDKQKVIAGITKAMTFLGGAMEKLGPLGRTAGNGLVNVGVAAEKSASLIGKLAGGLLYGGTAILTFIAIVSEYNQTAKEFDKQLEQNRRSVNEFGQELRKSFVTDRGMVGKSVLDTVSQSLDDMMNNLNNTVDKAPSLWEHLGDIFSRPFERQRNSPVQTGILEIDSLFAESDEINQRQAEGAAADLARAKIQQLKDANVDLVKVMSGSDIAFGAFIDDLRTQGQEGNEAAKVLEEYRRKFTQVERDMRELGPAGAAVKEGMRQISEAAADASQKLDGLRLVLEGLGYLKVNTLRATAEYQEAIQTMADKITESLVGLTDAQDAWSESGINLKSDAGRAILDTLIPLSDKFQALAASGKDVNEMWAEMAPQIDETVAALQNAGVQITKEQFVDFLQKSLGIAPVPIAIALQTGDGSDVAEAMKQVMLSLQGLADNGIFVPINFDDPEDTNRIDKKLEEVLGRDITDVSGTNLVLKPGIKLEPTDVQRLRQELINLGFQFPNEAAPQNPATIPTQVVPPNPATVPGSEQQPSNSAQQILEDFIGQAKDAIDEAGKDNQTKGNSFSEDFARGIRDGIPAIDKAAKDAADAAAKKMPGSPAKEGPLSGRGWSRYGGEAFSRDFAYGIRSRTGEVGSAAAGVAGAASSGIGRAGDKNYQAGQYLGQLTQMLDFFENATNAFGKLAETILGFAKFASDPLGKGTFFGKRPRWVRDPNISDSELARRRQDAAQQRAFSFYGSGRRPDVYDPRTGRIRGAAPGNLAPNAGKQDIANYIIQKAMSEGYSREQANMFVVQAVGESGLDRNSKSPNGLWTGIFQFDAPTWEDAGGGNITNPQENIDNYFNLARIRGLTPENFRSGTQLGEQVSIGGPWHPDNAAKGDLAAAQKNAQDFIKNYQENVGQYVDGIVSGIPAAIGNLPEPKKLNTGPGLEPNARVVAAILEAQFPGITQIGGQSNRPAGTPQMHTKGRALDVGIGSDLSLGDAINEFLIANAEQFGIQSTIWRNKGLNLVANEGGGPGTTYTAEGHYDHVHVQFADGGKMDIGPDGTTFKIPANSPYAGADFGLPPTPEELANPPAPKELVVRNPDGTFSPVHGTGDQPGPMDINPATGRPWTPEEASEFWNRPENALQYDKSILKPGDLDQNGIFQGTEDQLEEALKNNNPSLAEAIATAQDENASNEDVANALSVIEDEAERQKQLDTPQSRAQSKFLEGVVSDAASERGLAQEQSPIDQAMEIAGAATSVAGDIFAVLNSTIEAIGAAKSIADTLVRYPSNTEDIFNMVDDIQKFIQLGADIAGAVSSVASTIGGFVGAGGSGDPSGSTAGVAAAIGAVSQIAGLVQAGLETANAIIDLGQEAYRIVGSYVGDFLGILTGGAAGALEGQVRYLLDQQTNQLLAWSADNPMDKRAHDLAFREDNPDARNQLIGNINVYGGPGTDPRDMTRQMMFQVKASTMGQAVGQ